MQCRFCGSQKLHRFLDLGTAPPSNAYLTADQLNQPELWFPLRVNYCERCWLVQTEDYTGREMLFDENYAYFSSMSDSWLEHARRYSEDMTNRFAIGEASTVVEIASNDGYLLRNFVDKGVRCLGVEPTAACAGAARKAGIETREEFFGKNLAHRLVAEGYSADLMAANNVLAHVPNINDFVAGFAILLEEAGVATFEFPHLMEMVAHNQFDTVYHEHYSYLSLTAVNRIFESNGLQVFDVEQMPTHGGSLRVFAQRAGTGQHDVTASVANILEQENTAGMLNASFYDDFQRRAESIRDAFIGFVLGTREEGKSVAAYGAAAKGNTLLNYAGAKTDWIDYVVDRSPMKEGRFLPGSRIPIVSEERLAETEPDYIVIFPWNLLDELKQQLAYCGVWGGRFVTFVPELNLTNPDE